MKQISALVKSRWPALVPGLAMALLLVSPLFGSHYLRNLEPYPDGFLYTIVPLEYIKSGHWALVNQGLSLLPNVPPLYSVLMLPIMLFWRSPVSYVLVNVLLQLGVLFFLYLSLKKVIASKIVLTLTLSLYALNAVILWLAVLPMAENMGLFLTAAAIYLFSRKKQLPWLLALVAATFAFTKYTYYPMAAVLGIWCLLQPLLAKDFRSMMKSLAVLVVGGLVILATQYFLRSGPLLRYLGINFAGNKSWAMIDNSGVVFFSPEFLWQNIYFYLRSLFGFNSIILWQPVKLTSILISLGAIAGVVTLWLKNKQLALLTLVLFFSQFVALRNFYVQDLRYAILTVVFIIFWIGHFLGWLEKHKRFGKYVVWIAVLLLVSQFFVQSTLLKQIISANVFHRTKSWQQQAVIDLSTQGIPEGAFLVTALPPPLFTAYEQSNINLLPLSIDQEFISKGQNIWTTEVTDPANLTGQYLQWLDEGKELYITNAYITHQQSVIDDYELYKNTFDFELIAEGCRGTCDIYQLHIKQID